MSQGLITVANGSGAAVRAAINAALARLATKASGTARPADIQTGESWFETDNPGGGVWSLWMWDGTADCLLGTLATATHVFTMAAAGLGGILTTQGDIMYRNASAVTRLAPAADNLSALFSGGGAANPSWVGTWKQLGVANPSAASQLDFTGIPSTVNHILLNFELIVSVSGADLSVRTFDAGGSVDSGATDYAYTYAFAQSAFGNSSAGSNGVSKIIINPSQSNSAGEATAGHIHAANIQAARRTYLRFHVSNLNGGNTDYGSLVGAGLRLESDRITGIRILPSSGTITGKATLWGAI
jgi:hypothetical protein